ncbi:MAG TPA: hypothetical protein VFX51_23050 [Solirubrobacteraceae bacterium]|nr:hypothetical protein [Solirubrobacteraceae bacterium]
MSTKFKRLLAGLAAIAALALGGAAIAGAASDSDPADPGDNEGSASITAAQAQRAREAAVAAVPGETNQLELDGEKGATYEVEVIKPDGSQVDVRLDDQFKVVAVDPDNETGDRHD